MSYDAWVLTRHSWLACAWAVMLLIYHVVRIAYAVAALPLHAALHAQLAAAGPSGGEMWLRSWRDALPLFHALIGTWHQLVLEIPPCLALLLPLLPGAPAAARAWLLRNARAALLAVLVTHMLVAGLLEAALLAHASGGARVVFPMPLACFCAYSTLLAFACVPLRLRDAAPLLLLRATLPFTRLWLATPTAGAALQAAAAGVAWALVLLRHRSLRPLFARERAAQAAAGAKKRD